jgi:hypothetical protein
LISGLAICAPIIRALPSPQEMKQTMQEVMRSVASGSPFLPGELTFFRQSLVTAGVAYGPKNWIQLNAQQIFGFAAIMNRPDVHGIGSIPLFLISAASWMNQGQLHRRERLGRLLNYYRQAA